MSEQYQLTEPMRRPALNGDRRAAQLEHCAKVAEHRLEIEQRDNLALSAVIPTVTNPHSQTDLVRASLLIREGSMSKTKRKAGAGK